MCVGVIKPGLSDYLKALRPGILTERLTIIQSDLMTWVWSQFVQLNPFLRRLNRGIRSLLIRYQTNSRSPGSKQTKRSKRVGLQLKILFIIDRPAGYSHNVLISCLVTSFQSADSRSTVRKPETFSSVSRRTKKSSRYSRSVTFPSE